MKDPSLRSDASEDPGRHAVNAFVRGAAGRAAPGARVLDAGAGECIYRPIFEGRRYTAVDRGVGERTWDYGKLDARADLERIPFAAGAFDFVLCTETLEHVARPALVLRELRRVLKPGGTLALTVPFLQPVHQAPHDYYRYTPSGLRHLLAEAGFNVVSLSAAGGFFTFLHLQLGDLPSHLPLGVKATPGSLLSWPFRLAVRLLASLFRTALRPLRRRDSAEVRPLHYLVVATPEG
ncbi:MAG: class I SAM-dependent methyltransferase [Planctomycetes bacterium]|nr:class I SAM-dependent methyltransferase [Planctomycetota bacterium]